MWPLPCVHHGAALIAHTVRPTDLIPSSALPPISLVHTFIFNYLNKKNCKKKKKSKKEESRIEEVQSEWKDGRNMSSGKKTGSLSLEEQLVRILSKLPYHDQKHHENQKQKHNKQKHKQSGRGGKSLLVKNVLLGDGDVFDTVAAERGRVPTDHRGGRERRFCCHEPEGDEVCSGAAQWAPAMRMRQRWLNFVDAMRRVGFRIWKMAKKQWGSRNNFRFYKYSPGDAFGMHVDDSVDHGGGVKSAFTLFWCTSTII